MNILHINTMADQGGAAKAVQRLQRGLREQGWQSAILAQSKTKEDKSVFLINQIVRGSLNAVKKTSEFALKILNKFSGLFYWFYPSTFKIAETEIFQQADIINFHNLHGDYFNPLAIPLLAQNKPLVWTLHDMWPFTGHCTYSYDCQKWVKGCFNCFLWRDPAMKFEYPQATIFDLTRKIWKVKKDIYRKSCLHIVTPSRWMYSLVKKSILANSSLIEHIPWGIDLKLFYPLDKLRAKSVLGIEKDKKVLIFVSHSLNQYRKGFKYLSAALEKLQAKFNLCLLLLGEGVVPEGKSRGVWIKKMGYVQSEDLLRVMLNAADLLILPTLADNQPLVLIEAMACGTPTVAFDIGGISEMIDHLKTGYKARYRDVEDLTAGINTLLKQQDLLAEMSKSCREAVEREYCLQLQTKRYMSFYHKVLSNYNPKQQKI